MPQCNSNIPIYIHITVQGSDQFPSFLVTWDCLNENHAPIPLLYQCKHESILND